MPRFTDCFGVFSLVVRLSTYSVVLWAALFSFAAAESIERFHVDIELQSDGTMLVTEEIDYQFTTPRHGIYRSVSHDHVAPASVWYLIRRTELTLLSVSRNGAPEPSTVDDGFAGLSVRVGDPDRTVTGVQRYQIRYLVDGAINHTDEGQEIYWNATGNKWEVPLRDVQVRVYTAAGATLLEQKACYAGTTAQPVECETTVSESLSEGVVSTFSVDTLAPGQELTVAQGVQLSDTPTVIEEPNWIPMLLLSMVAWFTGLFVLLWRWERHHATGRSIVTQYEPFRDFKPLFTGALLDGRLDPRDITAGILYLAEQGFLSIKQTTDTVLLFFAVHDHEITLKKNASLAPSPAHSYLLRLLFEGQSDAAEVGTSPWSFAVHKEVSGSMNIDVGKTIRLSDIKKNSVKQKHNQKIIKALRTHIEKDLVDLGFVEQTMTRTFKGGAIGVLAVVAIVSVHVVAVMSVALMLLMLFVALNALIIMFVLAERRTRLGYEALDHLKGFRRFLSVTEKDRYAFHNAPSRSPQQFMKYLPYAIACGVEKEWAAAFKDITIESPEWYSSDVPHASFSAVTLSNELSSFSQALAASTGPAGSSGGGAPGGGSGGGGGGSW